MERKKRYFTDLYQVDPNLEDDIIEKRKGFAEKLSDLKRSEIPTKESSSFYDQTVGRVKRGDAPSVPVSSKMKESYTIPDATEKIDTKGIQKISSGSDFTKKIAAKRAALAAKRGLRAIPIIGGLAAGLMSDDASAAIPILDMAESTGPLPGSPDAIIEDPSATNEMRRQALEELRRRYSNEER